MEHERAKCWLGDLIPSMKEGKMPPYNRQGRVGMKCPLEK